MKKLFLCMVLAISVCSGFMLVSDVSAQDTITTSVATVSNVVTPSEVSTYTVITNFLTSKFSWVGVVLMVLGSLVVVGFIVDRLVPDKYDNNFMAKLVNVPIIGHFILFLIKFSPLNYTPDDDLKK